MGICIGIVGTGAFAQSFIRLFEHHPHVDHVVLCDQNLEKLAENVEKHGITDTEASLDAICAREDVDALAILTQHWMHAPQAVQGLRAGKHVCSAVPPAYSMEELRELVRAVKETGRTYMVLETSCFRQEVIWAREQHAAGAFGQIVYAEAEYMHDWSDGLEEVWAWRHGPGWEDALGDTLPFMYITHSTGGVMSVTRAHAVAVTSMGMAVDGDPYFNKTRPHGNDIANQVALLQMSDGSVLRVCEFRRIGHPGCEAFRFYGTKGSLEQPPYQWADLKGRQPVAFPDYSERLPRELAELNDQGHGGSHPHLVHEFVTSLVEDRMPLSNVWTAARFNAPGLVGVESARQGGILLPVPDFGDPPA